MKQGQHARLPNEQLLQAQARAFVCASRRPGVRDQRVPLCVRPGVPVFAIIAMEAATPTPTPMPEAPGCKGIHAQQIVHDTSD